MHVSAEIITTLGAMVMLLLALGVSMGWILREMNRRLERVDRRFEQVDRKFDQVKDELADLKDELTEVRISVALIEGTPPRFFAPNAR